MLFTVIKPMLPVQCKAPFDSEEHIFEPKIDGIRALLHADFVLGRLEIYTRHGTCCTGQFPEFQGLTLPARDVIIDGELTVFTGGQPDFARVMRRFACAAEKARKLACEAPATLVAFDVLYLDGEPVTGLPLVERKRLLHRLGKPPLVVENLFVEGAGTLLFEKIVERGLEGVVAKPKRSLYLPGRRGLWQKIKNYQSGEMDVIGYIPRTGQLLLAQNGVPVARAFGLTPKDRAAIACLLPEIAIREEGGVVYVRHGVKCNVKYTFGPQGIRECVFDGWITPQAGGGLQRR